jgi:hypothetical protein
LIATPANRGVARHKTGIQEGAAMNAFYLVYNTLKGWKLANAIAFGTLEEAKAAAARYHMEVRVSSRVPGDLGGGWSVLNESDFVEKRYTFEIIKSGRTLELDDCGEYETRAAAEAAGMEKLDDCCPPASPSRRFYAVIVTVKG